MNDNSTGATAQAQKPARGFRVQAPLLDGQRLAAQHNLAPKSIRVADVESAALLSRILALTGQASTPIIQFMPCSADQRASDTVLKFAVASATCIGRTLLLDATNWSSQERESALANIATGSTRGTMLSTARDAFVPALHHAQLVHRGHSRYADRESINEMLTSSLKSFRLIALDCLSPSLCPTSLALAPCCSGTIIVVHAGVTLMSNVLAASRDIGTAGGHVLGTVLTNIPHLAPAWFDATECL